MESPISIQLAAISAAQFAKGYLYRFKPGRTGEAPNWEKRNTSLSTHEVGAPITDRDWWTGRFTICTLQLRNANKDVLELVDAVASVSREKRIVTTPLVGRAGTVKEYINEGDWQINLVLGIQPNRDGVITDDYPTDELQTLRKFLDEPGQIEVASEFFKVFDITKIVIKSYSATQATEANYQSVSISAVSDEDYEIYSKDY